MEFSERVARLKAAMRMELYELQHQGQRFLVAVSCVSSYEASAARGIIDLGADLAIVAGGRKGRVRVCCRGKPKFIHALKFNLGRDLMMPLGRLIKGSGGGHALAASANGMGDAEEALAKALKILEEKLKIKLKRLSK